MGELKTNLTLQQAHSSAAPPPSPLATASPKLHPQQQPQHSPATSSGTADSDVPGAQLPTARHLDIHLTMRDQQYIAQSLQHPDGLSGTTSLPEAAQSSAAPPTSIYSSALTPYSNVSSFNYPAQCDSTLLTPISSAGSPPLHQGQKLGQQYPPPPTTPHQEHTPPNTDKMYTQWSQFDMQGQTSQTSSPMTAPAPVAPEFHMQGYMEDRRTPGPPEPYLGNYGVSNGPDQANIEHPYYVPMQPMEHATTLLMRDASGLEPEPHHGRPLPSTPLLNQPHPSHFRPSRRSSVEFHHHHPDGSRSMSGSPRRKPATHGNSRVKKRPSRRQSASQKSSSPKDPMDEHKNCHGLEVPPQLKPSCTEIDRMVVEARWKFRNKRGNDMWQLIQDEIQSKTGKKHGREDLQMKFRRSRLHIEWYPEDEQLLREAYFLMESERYHRLREIFHELGGSRNMCLNAVDVEAKAASLKLEEEVYLPEGARELPTRRRRKVSTKKRNNNTGIPHPDEVAFYEELEAAPPGHLTHEQIAENTYAARPGAWADEEMMHVHHLAGVRVKMEPGL